MRITIVCGAGASSTFVAKRLQKAADEWGLDLTARAGIWGDLTADEDADLILIGSHLTERLAETTALVAPTRVVVLPDACVRDLTGRETLAFVTGGAVTGDG